MMAHALRLTEDRFAGDASSTLAPLNRVLYVRSGEIVVTSEAVAHQVPTGTARQAGKACAVRAGAHGATVLHYELLPEAPPSPVVPSAAGVTSRVLLDHPIKLTPTDQYLMRCDRVEFAPGGVALPHRHKGGGVRCLIEGELEVRVGDLPGRLMRPGTAWFESGLEPVYAAASRELPTSFIRVSILPRSIKGMSSIMYVDPADAQRGKPRSYTVYVDEPIEIR